MAHVQLNGSLDFLWELNKFLFYSNKSIEQKGISQMALLLIE